MTGVLTDACYRMDDRGPNPPPSWNCPARLPEEPCWANSFPAPGRRAEAATRLPAVLPSCFDGPEIVRDRRARRRSDPILPAPTQCATPPAATRPNGTPDGNRTRSSGLAGQHSWVSPVDPERWLRVVRMLYAKRETQARSAPIIPARVDCLSPLSYGRPICISRARPPVSMRAL